MRDESIDGLTQNIMSDQYKLSSAPAIGWCLQKGYDHFILHGILVILFYFYFYLIYFYIKPIRSVLDVSLLGLYYFLMIFWSDDQ